MAPSAGRSPTMINCLTRITTARSSSPITTALRFGWQTSRTVQDSVEDIRTAGLADGKPCILVISFPSTGSQHCGDGRPYSRRPSRRAGLHSGCDRDQRHARPHDHDSSVRSGHSNHAADHGCAGDPGHFCFPPERLGHRDSRRGRAGLAGRHLRCDVSARLFDRQPVADGAHDLHRLRGGRCHRGDRKHHPLSRGGRISHASGAEEAQRRSALRCFR